MRECGVCERECGRRQLVHASHHHHTTSTSTRSSHPTPPPPPHPCRAPHGSHPPSPPRPPALTRHPLLQVVCAQHRPLRERAKQVHKLQLLALAQRVKRLLQTNLRAQTGEGCVCKGARAWVCCATNGRARFAGRQATTSCEQGRHVFSLCPSHAPARAWGRSQGPPAPARCPPPRPARAQRCNRRRATWRGTRAARG